MSDLLRPALRPLAPLLGLWLLEAHFPEAYGLPAPTAPPTTVFEPVLGGAFLLQRAEVPGVDAAPDLHAVVEARDDGTFLQHYFDSRGVVRQYAMTFAGGVWTLERCDAGRDFDQRFVGRLSADGRVIDGEWEGDFALTYRRRPG
jgi:hypothetical protein